MAYDPGRASTCRTAAEIATPSGWSAAQSFITWKENEGRPVLSERHFDNTSTGATACFKPAAHVHLVGVTLLVRQDVRNGVLYCRFGPLFPRHSKCFLKRPKQRQQGAFSFLAVIQARNQFTLAAAPRT